jgi:hypothetical protein
MNKGNLIRKYEDVIKRDYITEIIRRFERIRELLFFKGDLEQLVNSYLHYDKLIDQFQKQMVQIQKDIQQLQSNKHQLINKSVLELRGDGKLMEWLNNLSTKELIELKDIVQIDGEFRKIDDYRFNESKKNRGKKVITY